MHFTFSFIAAFLVLGLSALVGHSARVTSTSHEELEKRDMEGQGEEEWDEEEQPWKENGEVDAGGDEEMQEDGDGEMAPMEGDNEEGFPPLDDMPSDEESSNTKAVCCKCGRAASNGQTVFSCSTGGSCRKCKKYGGQKKAEKVAAPTACAKGGKGAHTACRNAFAGR